MSSIISFIIQKRKILISLFLVIGILSALGDTLILVQRPHDVRSKASGSNQTAEISPQFTTEFISPKKQYKVVFDLRQWTHHNFGPRVVFDLNKEYGFARLDIIEGESKKDLDSIKKETIAASTLVPVDIKSTQFKDKPAYVITYKENIIGGEAFYYKQIVKSGDQFFVFEKRAPQLGDSQVYLDNLLQGFSLVGAETPQQVKGISETINPLTTVQLVDLIRPSVASILHLYCLDVINLQPALSHLSNPKYNFCGIEKGSGFIVNEKGIVTTNGHVAKVYPEESLITNILYEGGRSLATDLIKGAYIVNGQSPTQQQVDDFYQQLNSNPQYTDKLLGDILKLVEQKAISIAISTDKYYINLGDEPVRIDHEKMNNGDYVNSIIPSATTYTGKLLGFNYPNRYSYEAFINKKYQPGSDVALLQIDNPSNNLFPALALSSSADLREGSEVVVAGYPILVEGGEGPNTTISYNSSTKPTVTKGIISAVKEDSSGRKVIQTDASIDHGNSGGPAVDSLGRVVGIATFIVESQSGNFNFLRSVEDLKELMSKNNIDNNLGEASNFWRKALDNYRNSYYSQAIKDFKQVESLSPAHPTVKKFIQLSQEAIVRGESLEGLAGFIKGSGSNILLVIFGGISITSFLLAGFLAALPLFVRDL